MTMVFEQATELLESADQIAAKAWLDAELGPGELQHVCRDSDIDECYQELPGYTLDPSRPYTVERDVETLQVIAGPLGTIEARSWVGMAPDLLILGAWMTQGMRRVNDLLIGALYTQQCASDRGCKWRKKPMDVDEMVKIWIDVLVGLSTAHSHEGFTLADHQTDELLRPMLSAPVSQIREWASKLTVNLRNDERVPFLIWSMFERVLEPLILKSPGGAKVRLRKQLATDVAKLVEGDLDRAELVKAIAGALQWRPPTELEGIKVAVKAGAKPHVTGRQSCLFLSAGGHSVVL